MKTALNLPGLGGPANIPNPPGVKSQFSDLGSILSGLINVAFLIAGFLLLIWLVWGVMQYIFAGGNKEALAKARSRITYAFIGFFIVMLSFAISQYARDIFPALNLNVRQP